jgi:Ca2+-binding RTX toxin-like protein
MASDMERTDMNRITKHLLLLAATAIALVVAGISAPGASAAADCSYSAGSVTVTLSPGWYAIFKRGPSGELLVDGAQCGSATIDNTNVVHVAGTSEGDGVTIDLSGGPFWTKPFGLKFPHEVKFDIDLGGGWNGVFIKGDPAAPDHIVAGSAGIDLNSGVLFSGVDVVLTSVQQIYLIGAGQDDTLSSAGDAVTGSPYAHNVTLDGGPGNDTITGGDYSFMVGGPDDDTIIGTAEHAWATYSSAPGPITADLGAGTATGAGNDTLSGCGIIGSKYDDTLIGDANPNSLDGQGGADTISGMGGDDELSANAGDDHLYGGDGNDSLEGGVGNDVIDGGDGTHDGLRYWNSSQGVSVDLAAGTASGQGSDTFTGIEDATGSSHDDVIAGDSGNNKLYGWNGNDTLIPRGGDDSVTDYNGNGIDTVAFDDATQGVTVDLALQKATGDGTDMFYGIENIRGSAHDDVITGGGDANVLQGMGGNDTLAGAGGNDALDGGAGADVAAYDAAPSAVTVNLASGSATGNGSDSLAGIETVRGSAFDDHLTGGPGPDNLLGLGGNDVIDGAAGNDILDGGAGSDTAAYDKSPVGVGVNLGTGKASGQGSDSLSGFEIVRGSAFADKLTGSGANDWLLGLVGNDTLLGGAGSDHLDGGAGIDTLSYEASPGGVNVNLAAGNALGNGTDTLTGFEIVRGSKFADTIIGGPANETLFGLGGNDKLDGGAGSDTLAYDNSPAGVNVNLAAGSATGEGTDAVSHFETVRGSAFADQLTGGPGADSLFGLGGNDTITGAGGNDALNGGVSSDTVAYDNAPAGVSINLAGGSASGDGNDVLSGFETVRGSAFADQLTGGPGADSLFGLAGNDVLAGAGGNDVLDGGDGRDTVGYAQAGGPVHVELGKNAVSGADGVDSLAAIESAIGSPFKDVLVGSKLANILKGGAGKDLLEGGAGSDRLYGEAGADSLHGGAGNDLLSGAAGKPDTCKQDQGHGKRIGCERH